MANRLCVGREPLYTNIIPASAQDVVTILADVLSSFNTTAMDIEYLYKYYKGRQDVLDRTKQVRPEINNKIVENRANEIVSFKVGYLTGEPIQYIGRGTDKSDAIKTLNEIMISLDKPTLDKEISEWFYIAGTAFRMVLPNPLAGSPDETPIQIFTLDPRRTFVVYHTGIGNRPVMGVTCVPIGEANSGQYRYSIYTQNAFYEIEGTNATADKVIRDEKHSLGRIPIIEYPANNARLGAFEIVLPLLNAMNTVASNRVDGVEQFVQSFIKFVNCEIDADSFTALKEMGAIRISSMSGLQADVDIITSELNQQQTQTLVDYMYQTILTICGMPNRNGGSSTSDTGAAVIMRDGWTLAEARAKDSELMFKKSEHDFLKLVLSVLRRLEGVELELKDIDIKFTRRNYEAIQSKAQVLTQLLQGGKVHPLLAFTASGLFSDPEAAYKMSEEYVVEQEAKAEAKAQKDFERQQANVQPRSNQNN